MFRCRHACLAEREFDEAATIAAQDAGVLLAES